jgi:hypothetical protein
MDLPHRAEIEPVLDTIAEPGRKLEGCRFAMTLSGNRTAQITARSSGTLKPLTPHAYDDGGRQDSALAIQ